MLEKKNIGIFVVIIIFLIIVCIVVRSYNNENFIANDQFSINLINKITDKIDEIFGFGVLNFTQQELNSLTSTFIKNNAGSTLQGLTYNSINNISATNGIFPLLNKKILLVLNEYYKTTGIHLKPIIFFY